MSLQRLDLAATATEARHLDLEPLRRRIRALAKGSGAPAPWKRRPATARGTARAAQDPVPAGSSRWVDA